MSKKIYILLLLVLLLIANSSKSQKSSLFLKSWVTKDSVMLRWAPANYNIWQKGNRYGYRVERLLLSTHGKIAENSAVSMLHEGTIMPTKEESWKSIVKKDSVWAPIALQALWGETFELTSSFKKNVTELYNKVKENELRFGFALFAADRSIPVAKALGLYIGDRRISKTEKYIYRVYISTPNKYAGSDTAYVVVDPDVETYPVRPVKPQVDFMGAYNLLTWQAMSNDYVGYMVERSVDGKEFHVVTKDLVIPFQQSEKMLAFFADSLQKGQVNYWYRLKGITPFGFFGDYSDTIKITTSPKISSPSNLNVDIVEGKRVLLSWNYETVDELRGFLVERSAKSNEGYRQVGEMLPVASRRWTDMSPLSSGYYRIVAVSKSGARGESLEAYVPLSDNTPPAAPQNLVGLVDSTGRVKLCWKPNLESDLMGYRIFRANDRDGEFSQLNSEVIKDTCFSDRIEIRTLTKKVYYKLSAVDKRYNSSEFSKVYELARPDVVAPAPIVVKSASIVDGGIKVGWIPSPSSDVKEVILYKIDTTDSVVAVGKFPITITSTIDTSKIGRGKICEYFAISVDSAGNRSVNSNSILIKNEVKKKHNAITLKGDVVILDNQPAVRLEWANDASLLKVYVYKKEKGNSFKLYRTLYKGNLFYDKVVCQGNSYEYMVKCAFQKIGHVVINVK